MRPHVDPRPALLARWLATAALTLPLLVCADTASAACFTSSTANALSERLDAAEKAYLDLDADGFGRALDDAALMLPCLDSVASPALSAHYHRLTGLRMYAAGDSDGALAAMSAARVLAPDYQFPDGLLPPDHALRRTYESLPTSDGHSVRPPQPKRAHFSFDGTASPRRPTDRATLVQLVADDGVVQQTAWIETGVDLPAYDAKPRTRDRFLLGSAVLAAASGTFYALAWTTHGPFLDPDVTDRADLESLQARSRTYSGLSGAALALSAGGVALAFTVGAP